MPNVHDSAHKCVRPQHERVCRLSIAGGGWCNLSGRALTLKQAYGNQGASVQNCLLSRPPAGNILIFFLGGKRLMILIFLITLPLKCWYLIMWEYVCLCLCVCALYIYICMFIYGLYCYMFLYNIIKLMRLHYACARLCRVTRSELT